MVWVTRLIVSRKKFSIRLILGIQKCILQQLRRVSVNAEIQPLESVALKLCRIVYFHRTEAYL